MNDSYNDTDQRWQGRDAGLPILKYNVPGLALCLTREKIQDFPQMQTPSFRSHDFETIYVQSGALYVVVNDEAILLRSREFLFVRPGNFHYLKADRRKPCVFYIGLMNESVFAQSLAIRKSFVHPFFQALQPSFAVYRRDDHNHPQMVKLVKRMEQAVDNVEDGHEILAAALCHEFLGLVWQEFGQAFSLPTPGDDPEGQAFKLMVEFIRQNYGQKITPLDLCKVGNVSRSVCFKLFSKYSGMPPAKFLLDHRIDRARTLLTNSTLSLSQIAQACGFTHQSHFGLHFLRRYGVTPLTYRQASAAPPGAPGSR